MVKLVATSEGIIPLKDTFNDFSSPPKITSKARALARKHGFDAREYGSDILLVKDGYEIRISNIVECFRLVRVPYCWWESAYPGYSIHKERIPTPLWVSEFNDLLSISTKCKSILDYLA